MANKISLLIFSSIVCLFISAANGYPQQIKRPVVSGLFYPASPSLLAKQVDRFIEQAEVEEVEGEIIALISPHAGYDYSGEVAAHSFKAIEGKDYTTVVIIGPSHYVHFDGASVYSKGAFRTPLGDVQIDSDLVAKLIEQDERIYFYPEAYKREHSIEVEVPFLQRTLRDFKIVPIVMMGDSDYATCKILAEALVKVIGHREDVLIVASSDMYHGYDYNEAIEVDKSTLALIEKFDPRLLFESIYKGTNQLCGAGPVISTLIVSKILGADKVKVLRYMNSGDVTGRKRKGNYCVGYGSMVIYRQRPKQSGPSKGDGNMLNDSQKGRLLVIARNSIEVFLKTAQKPEFREEDPELLKQKGAFVTITKAGRLRGCIGHIVADRPLYQTVSEMAIEAAVGDPRFTNLKVEELDDIHLEISVLSELKRINDVNEIKVGTHGIMIRKGFNSGLLLPQVATEYNWDREEFLENTCYKAGLPPDAWKEGADIYIFSAEVFGENK